MSLMCFHASRFGARFNENDEMIYALSQAVGKQVAIAEAEKLKLTGNHFYFMLLGVLYTDIDNARAKQYFLAALSLARTRNDKQVIQYKIDRL